MIRQTLNLFVLILSVLCSCTHITDKGFLTFDEVEIFTPEKWPNVYPKFGWYSNNSNVSIDDKIRYNNQSSLLIPVTPQDSIDIYFHLNNRDILGKKIVFSGKYKYQEAQDANVSFTITLKTFLRTVETEKTDVRCNGKQDWESFSVEMPLERTEHFWFRIQPSGDMKLWISDCQVEVDGQSFDIMVNPTAKADMDSVFVKNSGITLDLSSPLASDNLEVLGKVWGFMKYFHPKVVTGQYNWDYELFRVMPDIVNAKNKDERNTLLSKWIDKYGKITETEDYTVTDSTKYHRFADLDWLEDSQLFDKDLSAKLVKIKNAKRNSVFNYYVIPLSYKEEVEFTREKPYANISWEDQGYRILTLFRIWNAIEYCFPYTNYTDNKWSTLLAKYIPEFVSPTSEKELDRSILKLVTEVNDSHARVENLKTEEKGIRNLPIWLTQTYDGELVIESTYLPELKRGAVITTVKGKTVPEIIEYHRPTTPSSNEQGLRRNVAYQLFLTPDDKTEITFKYKGEEFEKKISMLTNHKDIYMERKKPEEYNLKAKNIVYIDVSTIGAEDLEKTLQNNEDAKGLILDIRKYPKLYTKEIFEKHLFPRPTDFMWFSINSKKHPGNFILDIEGKAGFTDNPNYFKGKVAILVNEYTQSWGEFTAIAYRAAPKSSVIGTQTAGANGHIGYLYLPRGIKVNYTMAGAFYPNWSLNQRDGVRIDIPVIQTVKEIEAGEDMWIKKAIEYIIE